MNALALVLPIVAVAAAAPALRTDLPPNVDRVVDDTAGGRRASP